MKLAFDQSEAKSRQEEIYTAADSDVWRLAVYEPLHDGWALACIGGRPFLEYISSDAGLTYGSRALELGCGAGAACDYLAHISGANVCGIEYNQAQYERAKQRVSHNPLLEFFCADATVWHAGETTFDAVFLLDVLSLVQDWERVLNTAHSMLSKGKALYIADLHAGSGIRHSTLERAYQMDGFVSLLSPEVLKNALFKAGFKDISVRSANHDAIFAFSAIQHRITEMSYKPQKPEFAAALAEWAHSTRFYLEAFESREFLYSWTRAA